MQPSLALQPAGPNGPALSLTGPMIALGAISFVSNLLMLTGPLFMLQVYDRVLASRSVPTLLVLTGLVCGLFAFYGFLDAAQPHGYPFCQCSRCPSFRAAVCGGRSLPAHCRRP
ncbi:hypothetical protein N8D56_09715 [Devosia sp. A8/3-2]|nr:hypothetical protein N8D56_09715 [Devosia sp. A8/3-2]